MRPKKTQLNEQEQQLFQQILEELCQGQTLRQIDTTLALQPGTAHRACDRWIFPMLGVTSRFEATAAIYSPKRVPQDQLEHWLAEQQLNTEEIEILTIMFRYPQLNTSQIAEALDITGDTKSTMRWYTQRIYQKLNVQSRAQAIAAVLTAFSYQFPRKAVLINTERREHAYGLEEQQRLDDRVTSSSRKR